jgi:hypothetical protein
MSERNIPLRGVQRALVAAFGQGAVKLACGIVAFSQTQALALSVPAAV